jgi:TldD protein
MNRNVTGASFGALAALVFALSAQAAGPANDAVVRRAMNDELTRTMKELSIAGEAKPHFASFSLLDSESYVAMASLGALTFDAVTPARMALVSLRAGTPELDSSTAGFSSVDLDAFDPTPLEDDYTAIRRALWLASDTQYKSALESLAFKQNSLSVRVHERTDSYPDFSPEPRHETVVPAKPKNHETGDAKLKSAAERLSRLLASAPNVLESGATALRTSSRRRLLTSEGTWADETREFVRISLGASTQADDGMRMSLSLSFDGVDAHALPGIDVMEKRVADSLARLSTFRAAPLAESGSAIVLFEGHAAAQLVQSLLVPGLSGAPPMRFVTADMDQSLAARLGLEVVSPLIDVVDDPTLKTGPRGEPLWGNYAADDEGVPARSVSLIERGVLKTLLMSRSPRKELRQSNAHYRNGIGPSIANLIVKTSRPQSRAKLIAFAEREAKKRGANTKVYVVKRLSSALGSMFSLSGMGQWAQVMGDPPLPSGLRILAVEAYVVSGGKEQPVRGLNLEKLDLRALKDVLGVGDESYVYNHRTPAESAIVTPSLLIPNIDVKRHEADNPKPPSYPAP